MIPAIVLAGGRSSRMGQPKALLPIPATGETFVQRIVNTLVAAGVEDIVLVVGADAAAIRQHAPTSASVRIVDNPDYDRGQLTSLLAGLQAIDRAHAAAALVTLVDVPFVSVSTGAYLSSRRTRSVPRRSFALYRMAATAIPSSSTAPCSTSFSVPIQHLVRSPSSGRMRPV